MNSNDYPIAIGGVGGSGTRLIAEIVKTLGYYVGRDLNEQNDNLWFTFLFKRKEIITMSDERFGRICEIFVEGMKEKCSFSPIHLEEIGELELSGRSINEKSWQESRINSALEKKPYPGETIGWGWKEPNTHIILNRLIKMMPNIKYIHVMRNGLDMAYSANQNQLTLWGSHYLGDEFECTPYFSLKFWCLVHKRILGIREKMGEQFMLLNYDDLCRHPEMYINRLSDFLGVPISRRVNSKLRELVKRPVSIGRHKEHGVKELDPADVSYVRHLGFVE